MTFQPCTVVTSQWHRLPYPPRPGAQCLCLWRYCLLLVNIPDRLLWLSLNLPAAALALAAALPPAAAAFVYHPRAGRLLDRRQPRGVDARRGRRVGIPNGWT